MYDQCSNTNGDGNKVLVMDELSSLSVEDIEHIMNSSVIPNVSFSVFHNEHNDTFADHVLAANGKGWFKLNASTVIVDMTSDCGVKALAISIRVPILRSSLPNCNDVNSVVIRPPIESYVAAAFSFIRSFGSCFARVVVLVEYQFELKDFPKCYKGTAIPLLARSVGKWPLTGKQINQTQLWLRGVASSSSVHYITVVGSGHFMNGIKELYETWKGTCGRYCNNCTNERGWRLLKFACIDNLKGWLELLPSTFHGLFVVIDSTAFNCSDCRYGTPLFLHSQGISQQPHRFPPDKYQNQLEAYYAWRALQLAVDMATADPQSRVPDDTLPDSLNLTLDVHVFTENSTLKNMGMWTESGGLQIYPAFQDFLPDPAVVRVAALQSPPFVFRTADENETRYTGYAIDILTEIASRLNLTFSFVEPVKDKFGVLLPNGSWDGVVADILAGSVDLAVGALTVTAEREHFIDFTTPFYEFAGIEILIKQIHQEQNLLFFVTVFSEPMWGAWFGVLLLTGLLLAAFDYLSPFSGTNAHSRSVDTGYVRNGASKGGEPRVGTSGRDRTGGGRGGGEMKERMTERKGEERFDLKEALWLVTASFTQSGPERTPRTLSSRVLVAGFWFFCTIIMANYTANLAAFLTTSRLSSPISSLQDLAKQSKVRYSVVRGTTTMSYFERMAKIESNFDELWKNISSNMAPTGDLDRSDLAVWEYPLGDTYVKIWSDIEQTGLLSNSQEGLERVIQGNFALIDEAPYLQYAIAQHCGLTTIGRQFSTKSYAFALPQASPLTQQLSNTILKLQSETTLEKLKQKWWQAKTGKCGDQEDGDGLSLHTLGGVFLLAGLGMVAGLLLCVLEWVWACFSACCTKKPEMSAPVNSRTDLVQEYDMGSSSDNPSAGTGFSVMDTSLF